MSYSIFFSLVFRFSFKMDIVEILEFKLQMLEIINCILGICSFLGQGQRD